MISKTRITLFKFLLYSNPSNKLSTSFLCSFFFLLYTFFLLFFKARITICTSFFFGHLAIKKKSRNCLLDHFKLMHSESARMTVANSTTNRNFFFDNLKFLFSCFFSFSFCSLTAKMYS